MQKTYLVSGAGTGIGQAIALELAKNFEARIVLVGRNPEDLRKTQALLPNPEKHIIISADITKASILREKFASINLESANLCGIIANAGIGGSNHYGKNDRWFEVIETNLTGTYIFVNEALPALRKSSEKFRHIILISSILAQMGVPGHTAYCASKAGLLGLMRSWATELCQEQILVNAICPGWVETRMARQGIQEIANKMGVSFEVAFRQQMEILPLKKWSQPSEISALVGYLVSPNQTSITGQALHINNGALMI